MNESILVRVLSGVAAVSALVGGSFSAFLFVEASGAPQQAAAAALGCMSAVVPYVIMRSVRTLTAKKPAA